MSAIHAPVRALVALTVFQLARSRRFVALLALTVLPLPLALYWSLHPDGPPAYFFVDYAFLVYVQMAIPLIALINASSLIRDEISSRTITYLVVNGYGRRALVAGRYAGYVPVTVVLTALPLAALYLVVSLPNGGLGLAPRDGAALLAVFVAAVCAYGSAYLALGVYLRHPLMAGLLHAVVWEAVVSGLPGKMPYVTISFYLRSLAAALADAGATGTAEGGVGGVWAALALAAATCLFLLIAMRRMARMDVA